MPAPPRRSWRPQLRLRTLVAFMIVAATLCGLWAQHLERFRHERQAAEAIARLGGRIEFRPAGPRWIPRWLDRGLRHHVVKVDLSHRKFTAQDLEHLKEMPKLELLLLNRTRVDAEGLAIVAQCRKLRILSLWYTPTTDEGLAQLHTLHELQRIDLHHTVVTGAGFESWGEMPSLTWMRLNHTRLDDPGLQALAGKAPNLRTLELAETQATGKGFAAWPAHHHLRRLVLRRARFDDAGASELPKFRALEHVDLFQTPVTDEACRSLGQLPNLTTLLLASTQVTSDGLRHLQPARRLSEMVVPRDVDFGQLIAVHRQYLPQCRIDDCWCCGCMTLVPYGVGKDMPAQTCAAFSTGRLRYRLLETIIAPDVREKRQLLYEARGWPLTPETSGPSVTAAQ